MGPETTISLVLAVVALAAVVWAALERRKRLGMEAASEARDQALESKWATKAEEKADMIVREIHHRVKNNFQTVSSLLNLHTRYLQDQASKDVLWEGQNRIKSMALIHTQLYQREETDAIAIHEYADTLLKELTYSYNLAGKSIAIKVNVPTLMLPVEVAVPLGLVIHELVLNSFKYAFPEDKEGTIWITLEKRGNTLFLEVKDNGVGLPEGMDPLKVQTSYGMRLLILFSMELKGQLTYHPGGGTRVTFECPLK